MQDEIVVKQVIKTYSADEVNNAKSGKAEFIDADSDVEQVVILDVSAKNPKADNVTKFDWRRVKTESDSVIRTWLFPFEDMVKCAQSIGGDAFKEVDGKVLINWSLVPLQIKDRELRVIL